MSICFVLHFLKQGIRMFFWFVFRRERVSVVSVMMAAVMSTVMVGERVQAVMDAVMMAAHVMAAVVNVDVVAMVDVVMMHVVMAAVVVAKIMVAKVVMASVMTLDRHNQRQAD